jgi:hypothetical protein
MASVLSESLDPASSGYVPDCHFDPLFREKTGGPLTLIVHSGLVTVQAAAVRIESCDC